MKDTEYPQYTIGEVVEMTGVSKARLDDYDRKGVLCPARVEKGRSQEWRLYSDADIERLGKIVILLEYEFRLDEIKSILDGEGASIKEIIEKRLEELRRKEYRLRNLLLFSKFVENTNSEFFYGLLHGPKDLDDLADLVRESELFRKSMERIDWITEDELMDAIEELHPVVDDFTSIDSEAGFVQIEKIIDRFCKWWDEWIMPTSEAGYLGFWSVFEEDTVIVEAVEEIGGESAPAYLQMMAFYTWMRRLMADDSNLIAEIAESAEHDSVVAIDLARKLVKDIGSRMGVADNAEGLSLHVLEYMRNIIADSELIEYLNYDKQIKMTVADLEKTSKVVSMI